MIFCKKYNPRGLQNGFGDFCFQHYTTFFLNNLNLRLNFCYTCAQEKQTAYYQQEVCETIFYITLASPCSLQRNLQKRAAGSSSD